MIFNAFLAFGELINEKNEWEICQSDTKDATFRETFTALLLTGQEKVNQNLEGSLHFITYPAILVYRFIEKNGMIIL